MPEWIEVLFGVETDGDPRHIVLDGVTIRYCEGDGGVGDSFANCKVQEY